MKKAMQQEFYERHADRNENIRREFWRGAGAYRNRTGRRKLILCLSHRWGLHPSGINRIVAHKPTWRITRADLLKELLPGLNALFGAEYDHEEYRAENEDLYLSHTEVTDDV